MIKVDANGIWESYFNEFSISCEACKGTEVVIRVAGAEEHGEVGHIIIVCLNCGFEDYGS